jgi:hypothetical protein
MASLESSIACWDNWTFWLAAVGTWLAIGAAVLLAVSGLTSMRYRALNRQLLKARADETERGKQANAKSIAEAKARAKEAEVPSAKFKAPRTLSLEQEQRITARLQSFAGQKFSGSVANSVPDAWPLWIILDKVLRDAHWIRMFPLGGSALNPQPEYRWLRTME